MLNCLKFYRDLYKWKKVLFVVEEETNDKLFDLLNSQIQNIWNDVDIAFATSKEDFSFLGNKVYNYNSLDELFSIVEENNFFKLFFVKNWYISVEDEYVSVLWKGFLDKLHSKWVLDWDLFHYYKDLLKRLQSSKTLERIHFINLLDGNSWRNELYLLSWASEWNGMVLIKEDSVYYPTIRKVSQYNEFQQRYILNLFEQNKQFFKKPELDIENDDVYVIALEKEIPIWMFELKDISWSDFKELWTVALDEELKWKNMFPFLFESIFKYLSDILTQVVVVTPNENLKKILISFWQAKINKNIAEKKWLSQRYEEVLSSNKTDWKNRDMYLVDLHKFK